MDFELSEEQRAIQETARAFARSEMMPHAKEWDDGAIFPVDTLRQAAALGFGGIYVKDDVGGSGFTRLDATIIFEELAQGCTSTAAYISIHNMVAWMIDAYGDAAQRRRLLPKLTTMEHFASYCLTEPDSGSDAGLAEEPRGARRRPLRSQRREILHLGRRAFRHLSLHGAHRRGGAARDFMPRRGERHARAAFRRAGEEARLALAADRDGDVRRLPRAGGEPIGPEGQGFRIAMSGLAGGRLNIAACSIGGAQFCLDRTIGYMRERKQFGTRLADFQALAFRIADYATELEAARLMVRRAASAVTNREPGGTRLAAMAKKFATDTGFEVVNGCLQLHGGYGYLRDHPIERVLRDVRVHQILEGTNEVMRLIVSRALLGN